MNNLFDLTGRSAIVVGGAGDLGRSIVVGLAESGASVVIIDKDQRTSEMAAQLASSGLAVSAVMADISVRDEINESFTTSLDRMGGRIDILVNSAGIQRRHPSEVFPAAEWDQVLDVNLSATFFYCQLAGQEMIQRGGGKIINVASVMSFFGGVTIPAYAASKGGVAQLTKALSNDWAKYNINVNAIAPGYMDTQLNTALVKDSKRTTEIMTRIPKGRWGVGDDMKGISIFLASPASDYITGAVIPVDGGYLGR